MQAYRRSVRPRLRSAHEGIINHSLESPHFSLSILNTACLGRIWHPKYLHAWVVQTKERLCFSFIIALCGRLRSDQQTVMRGAGTAATRALSMLCKLAYHLNSVSTRNFGVNMHVSGVCVWERGRETEKGLSPRKSSGVDGWTVSLLLCSEWTILFPVLWKANLRLTLVNNHKSFSARLSLGQKRHTHTHTEKYLWIFERQLIQTTLITRVDKDVNLMLFQKTVNIFTCLMSSASTKFDIITPPAFAISFSLIIMHSSFV